MSELLKTIVGPRPVGVHTLGTEPLPIEDLSPAPMLCFAPALSEGSTQLTKGDEVLAGHTLWSFGDEKTQPCPVSGKVHSIGLAPNIRGGKSQTSVLIEPTSQVRILPPLNDGATTTEILQRFREAGVHTNEALPRPLADALAVESLGALIIVAIDREPQVFASIQLFLERRQDLAAAAKLLRQVTGTQEIHLAVPAPLASTVSDVPVLAIPPRYPESLDPLLKTQLNVDGPIKTIAIDTALAALDAVRQGKIQDSKVLTVIGANGRAMGNYRVSLGTSFAHILSELDVKLGPRDKLVAGGPMRGFAQYSANGAVDAGVEALVVIREENIIEWTQEPCINCGRCLDACPIDLQVHLIALYAEFGFFERTDELDVEQCIDCGLCASVCTARRPLLQLIRLSKKENGSGGAP